MPAISSEALHWIPRVIKTTGIYGGGEDQRLRKYTVGVDEKTTEVYGGGGVQRSRVQSTTRLWERSVSWRVLGRREERRARPSPLRRPNMRSYSPTTVPALLKV